MGTITEQIRLERDAEEARREHQRDLRSDQRARRAELNRGYRARQKRETALDDLDQFIKAQNARIAATLQKSTERVNRARWGTVMDGDGLFKVTRHGTTECSAPVAREYKEQT